MNSKSLSIGVLSITAVVLFIANFLPVQPVQAETWKDRDFSVLTAKSSRSGEVVYVVDNRSGQTAVFIWDPATKSFSVGGQGSLAEGFQQ